MSSLSFLSKKSWHTGLQSNQEAVWKAEKSALEERKKLDELRKERERERELEELERLNVESGGKQKRRQERVDWMYQVPASVSNAAEPNKEELEEYLLGKKRVDKLLTKGDEIEDNASSSRHGSAPQVNPGSSASGMALGGGDANSDRDLASKIREDPMFAIRQQEQAAYQALLKDPARLRAMRKAAGMDVEKGESKEERRRRKEERRRRREEEEDHRDRRHHSSRSCRDEEDRIRRRRDEDKYSGRSEYDRRSRYEEDNRRRDGRDGYEQANSSSRRANNRSYRDEHDNNDSSRRSRSPYSSRRSERRDKYARSPSPKRSSYHENRNNYSSRQYTNNQNDKSDATERERQSKLEAMQKNAKDLSNSRNEYLTKIKEKEDEDLATEEALRLKVQQTRRSAMNGFGKEVKGSFLLEQERSLYGGGSGEKIDLADRLRRGRDTFQRFEND